MVKPPLSTKVSHKKRRANRVFTPPLPLLPARGLLSTKADLLTGFGKAYLYYSKTIDWFSYSSLPGEKERNGKRVDTSTLNYQRLIRYLRAFPLLLFVCYIGDIYPPLLNFFLTIIKNAISFSKAAGV